MKKFLPFMSGVYTTAPGLTALSRSTDTSNALDIDENYFSYLENKEECRREDISKYHCVYEFGEKTRSAVIGCLVGRMTSEYPEVFHRNGDFLTNLKTGESIPLDDTRTPDIKYISVFDALCSQLQEDIAVVQLSGEKDWLTAIHLCSPNHWDPRTKIGKPFNEIHTPVPGIERTVRNYQVMLKMIIDKEPFTRFAWGIATDKQLNHHPEVPPGKDVGEWSGRRMNDDASEFYVRTERQNLIGLSPADAFIFTIRTYFYKVSELEEGERKSLAKAINSMTDETLGYKGMMGMKDWVLRTIA
jgi:hypothetical protein